MTIPEINLEKYVYHLPKVRIADYPLADRSESKLLCVSRKDKTIKHYIFKDLPELLPENSLLIFNDTKVIPARLHMKKETGGSVELLCIEPSGDTWDPQIAMQQKKESHWVCIVGGKKIKPGKMLHSIKGEFHAEIIKRFKNKAEVRFFWDSDDTYAEIIAKLGSIPLPPYIKREPVESDKEYYQTVYANYDGSVAAPTAGLHFTNDILKQIEAKNNQRVNVTLHVGPGTFKPIDSNNISSHNMHREMISINKQEIENILTYLESQANPKVIAIGTTSVRTIETIYWLGARILFGEPVKFHNGEFILEQWEPYEIMQKYGFPNPKNSLSTLLDYIKKNHVTNIIGRTKLFIVPSYHFGIVNGIITNYHLPKSTLILLVAAFLGDNLWKQAYDEALRNDYRFLSYGDSSFLM